MMSTIIYSGPACRLMSFNVAYFSVIDIVARLTAGETHAFYTRELADSS